MRRPRAFLRLFAPLALVLLIAPLHSDPLRDWPVTGRDERDATVRAVQYLLLAHGYAAAADGSFGRGTERALQQFQRAHGLVAKGATNNPTWEALIVPLKSGSKGFAVKAAQVELRDAGYAVAVDGVFGPRMKAAVQKYQTQTGHTADGVIGRYTWYELVGGNAAPESN